MKNKQNGAFVVVMKMTYHNTHAVNYFKIKVNNNNNNNNNNNAKQYALCLQVLEAAGLVLPCRKDSFLSPKYEWFPVI